jgi:hypothetical protein
VVSLFCPSEMVYTLCNHSGNTGTCRREGVEEKQRRRGEGPQRNHRVRSMAFAGGRKEHSQLRGEAETANPGCTTRVRKIKNLFYTVSRCNGQPCCTFWKQNFGNEAVEVEIRCFLPLWFQVKLCHEFCMKSKMSGRGNTKVACVACAR